MPRSVVNRRQFLGSAAAITLSVLGCSSSSRSGPFAGQTLNVFVYAGGHEQTMREAFVPRFEQTTGARVNLHAGWWDGIAKLKTSPLDQPPFDLMITDATQGYPAAREGLFAQLNFAKMPNLASLIPSTLDNWICRDRHGVTYPDSVMTLAYHKKQISFAPTRWADLLRPELAGRIGLYSSFYMSLYMFACILADQQGGQATARQLIDSKLDEVLRFAREHRKKIGVWWNTTTEMIQALADQRTPAGNMHSPEYIRAMRENPDLGAVVPERNRAFVQVFWVIPAGTKKQELAEAAIDFLFSDELQREFGRRGSATSRLDSARALAEEDPFWKQLYPHTAEQFRTLQYYPYDTYASRWDELADIWDRTVLRGG